MYTSIVTICEFVVIVMSLDLLSKTKVMECHWIYSAGLRLRNVIGFFSKTKVMECHWIYSAGLRLGNVIGFTQQD